MRRRALIVLCLLSCHAPAPAPVAHPPAVAVAPPSKPVAPIGRAEIPLVATPEGVLQATVTETTAVAQVAAITTLTQAETQALIARLEPLPALPATTPTIRAPSAPPPRTGGVKPIEFVATQGKPVGSPPPFAVVRALAPPEILPTGEVESEAEIRIRFDEPMVPVASIGTAAAPVVTLAPAVPGAWHWLDSRVLVFKPTAARLPKATTYTVTVLPGAKAVSSATLGEPAIGTFATEPLSLERAYPHELRPDSPLALQFDQDFDPAKLALAMKLSINKQPIAWHYVDAAEAERQWAKNPSLISAQAKLGPHVAYIAAANLWPAKASIEIQIAKGTPSREGPLVTKRVESRTIPTLDTFHAVGIACGDAPARTSGARCGANGHLSVNFTTPFDPKSFRSDKVQIEGTPLQDHTPNRTSIWLHAPGQPNHAFTVVIGDDLFDVYGQPYTGPHRLPFSTTRERYEAFVAAPTGMHVLDPRFETPQWVVQAEAVTALRIQLYRVEPADYFAYAELETGKRTTPPGKLISDNNYPIGETGGVELRVDLRPALGSGGTGHVIAIATTTAPIAKPPHAMAWMQVTRLGLVARIDGDKLNAWVRDITPVNFLKAIPNASVSIIAAEQPAGPVIASDAEGHAIVDLLPPIERKKAPPPAIVAAGSNGDSAFTAIDSYERTERSNDTVWYVTDDRFMYKPGETAYIKGWIRWTTNGVNPDLGLPVTGEPLAYTLADPRGNIVATGTTKLSDQGGFDLAVVLPTTINLGAATFKFTVAKTQTFRWPIEVDEFRTPAFSVHLEDDVARGGSIPLVAGETIEMTAAATYYGGGGLPGAAIAWNARLEPSAFSPAGWSAYTFTAPSNRSDRGYGNERPLFVESSGKLSHDSAASIVYGLAALPGNRPAVLDVDAVVTDLDRTVIRAHSRAILVHPSSYYVGLRKRASHDDTLEAIVTDLDGKPVAGVPIAIDIEGVLGSERYRDDAKIVETQHCNPTSATAVVTCEWHRGAPELAYRAIAHIVDRRGRANAAAYEIPWWSVDSDPDLEIIPDRDLYRPGETAKLEIRSKVFPATAVVTFARQGVIAQKHVELVGKSTVVELPITASYIEDIHVDVDRVAKRAEQLAGSKLPLPEHTTTNIDLSVDVESARLEMTARPLVPIVGPGAKASFEVSVQHADKPVANAEVALIVVDEAVLSLSGRRHADPLYAFYRELEDGTSPLESFSLVFDEGDDLAGGPGAKHYALGDGLIHGHGSGTGSGYGIGGGRGGMRGRTASAPTVSRNNFNAVAVFAPMLHTDANGKATVTVTMPDSLTRFRVVALATAQNHFFGKAEGSIVVQRAVNARTVAPRFLTQGDKLSLPVVVQNLDGKPRAIDVAVRAGNLAGAPLGKRITLQPGERGEVRFDLATLARGRAVVQTIAATGDLADASTIAIPVYVPATTESFATYGIVDDAPKFEQLAVPKEIFPDVGGVEVELASTQLQSLTDAFWYLYAYPYECAEQRSSRMLATAGMIDILDAFATPGRPSRTEIDEMRAADLQKLTKDQLPNGGWGYFAGMQADPYVTMQVLAALVADHASGPVVAKAIARVEADLAKAIPKRDNDPAYQISLAAAGLAALSAAGVDVRARAERLHATAEALHVYPVDAKARLLAIVAKRGDRAMRAKLVAELLSATHETAGAATVTTSYVERERLLLVSATKTSALVLDALIREVPENAVIGKLARGILDARSRGRWGSTQENLAVIGAMRRYFETYEKVVPNYTGKLWLGSAAYVEQPFVGRSSARASARLDWTQLAPGSTSDVALVKDGPGRMYYRLGITYAPKQLDLPALDAGFVVRRHYTPIDAPADVATLPDGRLKIRLGARVIVSIETIATSKRHAVAIVDPLPAGLEAVNGRLANAERAAVTHDDTRWDFQNLRDARSEAFAMNLDEGTHTFSYTARATTPGTFIAAPSKAEEMYSPETFGRSVGQTIVIE